MKKSIWVVGSAGIMALALSAGVFAQTTSTTTQSGLLGSFESALASKLGISVSTLQTDIKDAATQAVDQAVANGTMTQDQANKIKEKIQSGQFPNMGFGMEGRGHGPKGPFGGGFGGNMLSSAAKAIGITQDELMQGLRNGQTITQIAQAHGKTADDVKQAIINDVTARQQSMEQKLSANLDTLLNRQGVPSQQSTSQSDGTSTQNGASTNAGKAWGHRGAPGMEGPVVKAAASFIGITPDELMQAVKGGQSIAQVAEAHGKTEADLKQAILNDVQQQAQQRLQNLSTEVDKFLSQTFQGFGHRGDHGAATDSGTSTQPSTPSTTNSTGNGV